MAEPGETLFAPQTAPQLLDGQPVDVPALDGLLRQVLNGLTDLGSDAAESDSLHNVIAWVEVGLVALVGLEVGRRWQRRRTAPLIANADWLGWIDLDGPSPETLR